LTRGHLKKIKKIQQKFNKNKIKNSKKSQNDTWHAPKLTRVHLIKLKKIKKN